MNEEMKSKLDTLIAELNEAQVAQHLANGYTHKTDVWCYKGATNKWVRIDVGGSGAFLMDSGTGELYNIKGYGVPDHNKKKKADIGSVFTANGAELLAKRWNYLKKGR